jgi:hypothetical protein
MFCGREIGFEDFERPLIEFLDGEENLYIHLQT